MDLREMGWHGIDWIDLAQGNYQWGALMSTVMNFRGPQNTGKFLSSCTIGNSMNEWDWKGWRYDMCMVLTCCDVMLTGYRAGRAEPTADWQRYGSRQQLSRDTAQRHTRNLQLWV
jgi:hypothetical protein